MGSILGKAGLGAASSAQGPDDSGTTRAVLDSRQDLLEGLREDERRIDGEQETQALAREQAQSGQEEATRQLEGTLDQGEKDLAAEKIKLERARFGLAKFHEEWLRELKRVIGAQASDAEELLRLEGSLEAGAIGPERLKLHEMIVALWRRLTDSGLRVFRMAFDSQSLPRLPPRPKALLANLRNPSALAYETAYAAAEADLLRLVTLYKDDTRSAWDQHYRLMSQASQLRSASYASLPPRALETLPLELMAGDVLREIKSIPYRIVGLGYAKYLSYRHTLNLGVKGFLSLAYEFLVWSLILLMPAGTVRLFRRLIRAIDRLRADLVKSRYRSQGRLTTALWLRYLTPYIPWLTGVLALWILALLLDSTAFQELKRGLPIILYFVAYRLFRLMARDLYQGMRTLVGFRGDPRGLVLIEGTASLVGRFFLSALVLLYITELAVGRVLVYALVSVLMRVFGLLVTALAARRWDFVLVPVIEATWPPWLAKPVARACRGPWALAFCLPAFLALILSLSLARLIQGILAFDMAKRLAARLYRHRVKARGNVNAVHEAAVASAALPESYTSRFTGSDSYSAHASIEANATALAAINLEIREWSSALSGEQSVALVGEEGLGKTVLLERLAHDHSDMRVIRISVPAKTTTAAALNAILTAAFGFKDDEDFVTQAQVEAGKDGLRTLVLVDTAQNLFLGTVNGFAAYLELIRILNAQLPWIFWCFAFTEHAWTFLEGYFARNQYIRTTVRLRPWSDEAIMELILGRHASTGLRLTYDQVILATETTSGPADTYAERQFFRLLWEQSRGNPRVAMHLWLKSLRSEAQGVLHVGLPQELNWSALERLKDDSCFTYAAIARHESLSRQEIVEILNIQPPAVTLALKLGAELGLLEQSQSRRYRLTAQGYHAAVSYLKGKNFLYGYD